MFEKFIVNSILLISIASCEKVRFDNYTLYKILPQNGEQIKTLQDIRNNDLRYDFWSEPVDALDYVSVMSSPQDKNDLEDLLNRNRIMFDVTMKNVQEFLDKETVRTYTRSNLNSMTWDAYYNLRDIHSWLVDIALDKNGDVASIVTAGRSHEGREILGVKISHGPGRRAVLVEGTMHAREWITTTAVCYIINELLSSNDTDTMAAARDFDWYIFPVTNPDGYVWSHERFRMWRKNRRPTTGDHIGVDLNRNWNSNWLVSGASTNPASDIYAGTGPFSEPESRSFSSYIHSIDKLELFLSFHSFGHLLLVPFGNSTEPYDNYHDAINIGRRAMGALSVRYGTQYVTGNIAEAIYMATGGCIDWVKERAKVPLVYCYELRDRGQHGFLLPEDQILPNNQEVMDSVLELIHQARRFGYMTADGVQTKMYTNSLLMFILVSWTIFL